MNSNSSVDKKGAFYQLNSKLQNTWLNLRDPQKSTLKKIWSIITYKWQWQIILNTPFLVIWFLDQNIPAVHSFNMELISSLPIPMSIKKIFIFS